MREILFRGKCKETGKWYKGNYINLHKTTYCFKEDYETDKDNDIHQIVFEEMTDWGLPNRHLRVDVIPETVGQYTGLVDKHGTKIFTGDIIETDNGRVSAISVVKCGEFEPKMFYDLLEKFVMPRPKEKMIGFFAESTTKEQMLLSNCSKLIKVIGNIHDNPELLKLFLVVKTND